jgi:alpha-galactosidase/6-phospho-beta-glucosidase family protein
MDNVLEFLDKDRQRMVDFFNDIVTNKKLSEPESVDLITKVLSDYNDKLLVTVENMEKRKDDLREKEMPKYYETLLEQHRMNLENSLKPRDFGDKICDFAESFAKGAEAISKINVPNK